MWQVCFLTSDIFPRNSLIPLTPGIRKALHRPFRSDVWIQSQTVVCFSLWSDRFCTSVPAASGREPRSRSGQRMSECVLHRWSRGLAWHSVRLCPCGEESRTAQRSIPSDAGRTHRVAKHLETLAQVLQAAERHITDRDMSPDPLWGPVIDGPDLDGVDTPPTHRRYCIDRKTGVELMLTKQENYRDPEAVA